jgi:hypothetical protein
MPRYYPDREDTTRAGLTISALERLLNTPATGNPRWHVYFTNGTSASTSPNADITFGIENSEYRGVPLTVSFDSRTGDITKIAFTAEDEAEAERGRHLARTQGERYRRNPRSGSTQPRL